MEASQLACRAGAPCRDLTSSLIAIQNLISVHMGRRAGQLSEISLEYWRDLVRPDEQFPIRTLHSGYRDENVYIAHELLIYRVNQKNFTS